MGVAWPMGAAGPVGVVWPVGPVGPVGVVWPACAMCAVCGGGAAGVVARVLCVWFKGALTWFVVGFCVGMMFTFCRLDLCSLTSSDVDFRGTNSPMRKIHFNKE